MVLSNRTIHHMNVELDRNILGREARIVAASLIFQFAVDGEITRVGGFCGSQSGYYGKRAGVNVQFFAGIERECEVFSRRIYHAYGRQIAGRFEF
jgi:hypothetical protein